MKNKTWKYWVVASIALLLVGCGGGAKKQTNEEVSMDSTTMACDGLKTLQLDGVKVTWIQDNAKERLMERTLFADASDELIDSLKLADGIPSSMSTFLVETDGVRILFDTGMGAPDSRLLSGLASLGVTPADIKYLYLTHFHGDHIGGMMKGDSIVFPNAEVYASKVEYDAWLKMPSDRNVVTMNAEGHTPGHTVYQAGKLLVIADLIHGAALQLEHPEICAAYDMDKDAAVKSRKHFLRYAKENGLTMAGMHLPPPGFK